MLFRLVRPMRRIGSQSLQFTKRIPESCRPALVGRTLEVPLAVSTVRVAIGPKTQHIRFSLRTNTPSEAKARQAKPPYWRVRRRTDAEGDCGVLR